MDENRNVRKLRRQGVPKFFVSSIIIFIFNIMFL